MIWGDHHDLGNLQINKGAAKFHRWPPFWAVEEDDLDAVETRKRPDWCVDVVLLHSGDPKHCKLVFMGDIREYIYIYVVKNRLMVVGGCYPISVVRDIP